MTLTWHAYAIKSRHIRRPSSSSAIWRPCWQKTLLSNDDDDSNKNVTYLHIRRWITTALNALLVQFSFCTFSRRFRSFHYLILKLCARRELMPTNVQFNSRKVRTHFAHVMALNNLHFHMTFSSASSLLKLPDQKRGTCNSLGRITW